MKAVCAALALLLSASACRTARPTGAPVAPLTATTAAEAQQQLQARRASFDGVRSLMRVRATANGQTQSFRAQLAVHDAQRMELIAYTPVGTTALTLEANGHQVTTDPAVAPEAFAFLRESGLTPAEMGMLLVGLPPRADLPYEFAAGGLSRVSLRDVVVTFDPPSFPAQNVVVTRGADRVEITHLEVVE